MLLDSIWPIALIVAGCACVVSAALAYDRGHERGYSDARSLYEKWLGKAL